MTVSLTAFATWRPAYLFVGLLTAALAVTFGLTHSVWKGPTCKLRHSLLSS